QFERTDYRLVLKFAEDELVSAVEDLPFRYGINPQRYYGEYSASWQKVLFNKITAYAILSHLAAYQGKYIDVASCTGLNFDKYPHSEISYTAARRTTGSGTAGLTGYYGIVSNSYPRGQVLNLSASYVYGEATSSGRIEQLTLSAPVVNRANPDIYVSKDTVSKLFADENDRRFGIDRTDPANPVYRENYFTNFNRSEE